MDGRTLAAMLAGMGMSAGERVCVCVGVGCRCGCVGCVRQNPLAVIKRKIVQ